MKIKTSELSGPALRWAVAKAGGYHYFPKDDGPTYVHKDTGEWHSAGGYQPDTKWSQGGPIIERERIECTPPTNGSEDREWMSTQVDDDDIGHLMTGPTPLIAAMRCYVASELGDEVDVPEELIE